MQIKVSLEEAHLPLLFTSQATVRHGNQPIISFPITVLDIPRETQVLALSLIDYDAVPRTGFPFIHWLAANIPTTNEIPMDFSRLFNGPQGQNSWMSRFYHLKEPYFASHYAGPNPPDQMHRYTLSVYALGDSLNLKNGFYYNHFLDQLGTKIISTSQFIIPAIN